eukprot:CAMPEP_0113821238 /NCGR_PEP_ID=MMETSP0328-20130328/1638_1 /TAXON_ID=39455 /ORGANISM="Alexandrium minutum" /LENGTH=114 /DNA_ID=CAMNT_0000789169 /DNA_START=114 /DNA_END=459 /DNA_ORIENTATION=+ /assembly_acc=CAM_ASM_000350
MARFTPLILCVLAAAAVLLLGSSAMSFVGGAAGAPSYSLRASQRAPEVAMNFFGGAPPPTTTTPPPPAIEADQTYVIGITAFFFACVAANGTASSGRGEGRSAAATCSAWHAGG